MALIKSCQKFGEKAPDAFYPLLASAMRTIWPSVFGDSTCGLCGRFESEPKYTGWKPLPPNLYEGSNPFPNYASELFPLVYQACLHCGCCRICPTPHPEWVDEQSDGQSEYMFDPEYKRDKEASLAVPYNKLELEGFKTGTGALLDIGCGAGVGLNWMNKEGDGGDVLDLSLMHRP